MRKRDSSRASRVWEAGSLSSNPASAIDMLDGPGRVTKRLCASISPVRGLEEEGEELIHA